MENCKGRESEQEVINKEFGHAGTGDNRFTIASQNKMIEKAVCWKWKDMSEESSLYSRTINY